MAKTKKKLTKEEKLAKDRERKRLKYVEIKNNPELYKIQKEKDRMTYLKKKEKKQICSVKELSARAQRELRKRWRKNSLNYLRKKQRQRELEKILIDNSPPESDNDIENIPEFYSDQVIEHDPLVCSEKPKSPPKNPNELKRNSKMNPSLSTRKFRYRAMKTIKSLKAEIEQIKKDKIILQKKTRQLQEKLKRQTFEDSVEKTVNNVLKNIQGGKVEEAKRKLLFDETLSRGLATKYKTLNKGAKRNFAEDIVLPNKSRLTKHKLLSRIPFSIRKTQLTVQNNRLDEKKQQIEGFFEDDVNSRVAAGKGEFVKKGNIKKQKRYLNDSLKNLHAKYCVEKENVSYSVFCKYRPYWVVFPKHERDTCQCKLHANVNLLIKALKKNKITSEGSPTDILNSLCCNPYDENCLGRSCDGCKEKQLMYMEFNNSEKIYYFEWVMEKQNYTGKGGQQKIKTVTTKKKFSAEPINVINKLTNTMTTFFQHVRNIISQYSAVKKLKQNLTELEVLIHVDFSENYCFKYNEEVQSYHFGGSRGQVSLHTVVMYYLDSEKHLSTRSICTMSQDVTHDASAIWAHIIPLLNTAKQLVPSLSKVHFLSDSPSSQYRNRFIFYMIAQLHLQIPTITTVSWNYQESGHGKGAPDGIGAVIKRTADNFVQFGGDVGCFDDFVNLIRDRVQGIEIYVIPDDQIQNKKFPAHVPGFKGTTKVHQALWSTELPYSVALRCLSCFICLNSYLPCDHQKHIGMLSLAFGEATNASCTNFNDEAHSATVSHLQNIEMPETGTDAPNINVNEEAICSSQSYVCEGQFEVAGRLSSRCGSELNLMGNDLEVDLVTLCNNVKSDVSLGEIDTTMFLNETVPMEISPKKQDKKLPIILSNVLLDTNQLKQAQSKNSLKRKTGHQQDFERFLESSKIFRKDTVIEMNPSLPSFTIEKDILTARSENLYYNENNKHLEDGVLKYNLDDWVVVKYSISKNKSNCVHYVGKIMETIYNTLEYKVGFLKKSQGKTVKFSWPLVTDEDNVNESQIIYCLNDPEESRRGQLIFDDLPNLNFK